MAKVFELLDDEWQRLAVDRGAARHLTAARRAAGAARTLGELEHYVRHAGPAEADRVLLVLVAGAVEGDDLAARVLLQLLLPGTRALARRWWALGDRDERAAAAVAAVYGRIRCYPLARRPGRVAANVLMDASRDMRRALPRADTHVLADVGADVTIEGLRWTDRPSPHPAGATAGVELTQVLCEAVHEGLLAPAEASLIARSRIAGHRLADLGRERGVPERTLFAHRQRAERRLAASYAAAH